MERESDNDVEKGVMTETEENEIGEVRKITTETRTTHVICKNTLGGGGTTFTHNNKSKRMYQKKA